MFSVAVAINVFIPELDACILLTRLDGVDELLPLLLLFFDSDSCSCCCCLFIPISDPVIVPNGSEVDGDDDDEGVGSRNGGLSCCSFVLQTKPLLLGCPTMMIPN